MTDIFTADALHLSERGAGDDPDVIFEGVRTIRIETTRAEVPIDAESRFGGVFPTVIDTTTGTRLDIDESEVFRILWNGPDGPQTETFLFDFIDDETPGVAVDYLVRISGPALPPPAPGTDTEAWLTSIGATRIEGSGEEEADPPFFPLTGRYADGGNLAFDDIEGLAFEGPGLTIGEATLVALLYDAGLDRNGAVDLPGLNFWIDSREAGASEAQVARQFLRSAEFETAFGNALDPTAEDYLSNEALVRQLYRNVLDREGEQGGVDFWTGLLDDGAVSRARLLVAFADSAENREASTLDDTIREVTEGDWVV